MINKAPINTTEHALKSSLPTIDLGTTLTPEELNKIAEIDSQTMQNLKEILKQVSKNIRML